MKLGLAFILALLALLIWQPEPFVARAERSTAPPEFLELIQPTPLGEGFRFIRVVVSPDHGCLLLISTTGLGSPKPTMGCW